MLLLQTLIQLCNAKHSACAFGHSNYVSSSAGKTQSWVFQNQNILSSKRKPFSWRPLSSLWISIAYFTTQRLRLHFISVFCQTLKNHLCINCFCHFALGNNYFHSFVYNALSNLFWDGANSLFKGFEIFQWYKGVEKIIQRMTFN